MKRKKGLTEVYDKGLGVSATEDLVDTVGEYLDVVRIGYGAAVLYPPRTLQRKIALLHTAEVDICSGGTTFERYVRDNGLAGLGGDFLTEYIVPLGMDIVEVATNILDLTDDEKVEAVRKIASAGMRVHFEIGSKVPADDKKLGVRRRAELMRRGLDAGAEKIKVEGRESGVNVGFFDEKGAIMKEMFQEYLASMEELGVSPDDVIWEAPLKNQQIELIKTVGPEVNLGNVNVNEVMLLEGFRQGVKYETAAFVKDGGMMVHGRGFWVK